jgi:hypothetical protein
MDIINFLFVGSTGGLKNFVWFLFVFQNILFIGVMGYIFREWIWLKYYQMRFPERILKVVIHYKSRMFSEHYRLSPDNRRLDILDLRYNYYEQAVVQPDADKSNATKIFINGVKYNSVGDRSLKKRFKTYPEVHYFYNNPNPIDFEASYGKTDLTSLEQKEFEENKLFEKLLNIESEKLLLLFCLILGLVNMLLSIFILGKTMGWFDKKV